MKTIKQIKHSIIISFEIANYISNKLNNKNDKIYIYKNNIIYWLLKKYPPTDIPPIRYF